MLGMSDKTKGYVMAVVAYERGGHPLPAKMIAPLQSEVLRVRVELDRIQRAIGGSLDAAKKSTPSRRLARTTSRRLGPGA